MSNQVIERKPNGQFAEGVSGNLGGNAHRSRHALNADTIREMHAAFRRDGRAAIDKVMKQQPAVFLKLLVLLVPREMRGRAYRRRQGDDGRAARSRGSRRLPAHACGARLATNAKVIEAVPEPVALPAPSRKPRRKRGAEAKASPLLPDEQGESE